MASGFPKIQSLSKIRRFLSFPTNKDLPSFLLMRGSIKGHCRSQSIQLCIPPLLQSVVLTTLALLFILDFVEAWTDKSFRYRLDIGWFRFVQIEK